MLDPKVKSDEKPSEKYSEKYIDTKSSFNRASVIILTLAAATWLLERMSSVLIPFVFAIFLFYNVLPIVRLILRRKKINYTVAVFLALATWGIIYLLLGLMVASSLKTALHSVDSYRDRLSFFNDQLAGKATSLGYDVSSAALRETVQKIPFFTWLSNLSGELATVLGNAGLVMIFLGFLLFSGKGETIDLFSAIEDKLTRYVVAKTVSSVLTGLLVGVSLALIGVDLASFFGLISVLMNFIPSLGFVVSVLAPLPIVILQYGFGPHLFFAILIPVLIQFSIGNLLEPKWIGGALDLHPITILLALIYWGVVWGVVGMFLAVPITAVLKIVFDRFSSTQSLGNLMAGRFQR